MKSGGKWDEGSGTHTTQTNLKKDFNPMPYKMSMHLGSGCCFTGRKLEFMDQYPGVGLAQG